MEFNHPAPGVYASLEDLIQMKFQAKGFCFHSKQAVQSLLSGRPEIFPVWYFCRSAPEN